MIECPSNSSLMYSSLLVHVLAVDLSREDGKREMGRGREKRERERGRERERERDKEREREREMKEREGGEGMKHKVPSHVYDLF